jgi:hypothetical protein
MLDNNPHITTLSCKRVEFHYEPKQFMLFQYQCQYDNGYIDSLKINLPMDRSLRQIMNREKQDDLGTITSETFDLLDYKVTRYLVTIKV